MAKWGMMLVGWTFAAAAAPEPREIPRLGAWFVDEAGAHRLSLDIPAERAQFEAACRRYLGDDLQCDVRRVRACQPGEEGVFDAAFPPPAELWSGPACAGSTLVLVPADVPLDEIHPRYASDHPAHAAARLGAGKAALWVFVRTAERVRRRAGETEFALVNVAVDPWDLQVHGRKRVAYVVHTVD